MKLHLENIKTKVGTLVNQSVEVGSEEAKLIVIFETPNNMATIVDIDDDNKEITQSEPIYNTLVVSGSEPFIVFSVHYDRRYVNRKFRNYRY